MEVNILILTKFVKKRDTIEKFRRVTLKEESVRSITQEDITSLWKKPPTSTVKLNWDVAVVQGCIGICIIARDNEGLVLAARSTTMNILVESRGGYTGRAPW